MDSLVQILNQENQLIGSFSLYHKGKVYYEASFGQASPTKDEGAKLYRIGSISKTFTATMVMKAIEEGELSLDRKLSEWFPKIPNADQISIKMMLGHRSGIHNFTDDDSYLQIMEKEQSREAMLSRFASMEPDFTPDSDFSYSNTNYVLLSYILEDIYQQPIANLLIEKIADPLKLKNTYFYSADARKKGEQESFYWTGEWTKASNTHPSVPLGAGGIVSSTGELCQFMRALQSGKILDKSSVGQMKNGKEPGLALFYYPFYSHSAYGHNGGIDGFVSHASYMAADDLAVAVCLNGSQYPLNQLLIDILSIYFEQEGYQLPSFEKVEVAVDDLQQYSGTYKSDHFPLDIKFFVEEGVLKGQATGQPSFPMEARGNHVFEFKAATIKVTFDPENGTMVFEQAGQKLPFKR
ncbi:serine hydrolase domain-containing protein [Croceimicrobium sp.]|uniref:serine hydrolase domain-containing protein n=1 Tax=Croceimicrobium sp. TaxID=2828340 RepID=UPI003BA99544